MIQVKFEKINEKAKIPSRQNKEDAGFDLSSVENIIIPSGERRLIKTGLKWQPMSYDMDFIIEGQIRPRSGLALKNGISITNSPGTIDASYRGEICVLLENRGIDAFPVIVGDRIAQLVINRIPRIINAYEGKVFDENDRGGGFGSTGV